MSVSPYFPTGFLEGVFDGILYISPHIFPKEFWRRLIKMMMMFTRIIEAEIRGSVRIN
jgi:hypothetical protein